MKPMFSIYEELNRRILILDGGMGTMIQSYELTLNGCNDLLVVTHPEIIGEIHDAYLNAGANIISTNTFNANAISLSDYGLQEMVYEINYEAALLARQGANKYNDLDPTNPRFVAGSVGPTNKTASLSSDLYNPAARAVTFDLLWVTYHEQMRGLLDGGADVILIETVFDTLNAKAALYALDKLNQERGVIVPVMISGTLTDASGRVLSGQTLEALCVSLKRDNLLSIGLNCGFGAEQMLPFLERIARIADSAVSVHPNAGLPNAEGKYDQSPEDMARTLEIYLKEGLLNIVGGCCGTRPAHIEAMAKQIKGYQPRKIPTPPMQIRLSGLEELSIPEDTEFAIIGERANIDFPDFAGKIHQKEYEAALYMTSKQLEQGAQLMSVCMDDEKLPVVDSMREFLYWATFDPRVARVPFLIDSYSRKVWQAALGCLQGRGLVRAISLKKGDQHLVELIQEIRSYGALPIIRLVDEQGAAHTYDRKIEIAERIYTILKNKGIPANEIILDPLLSAISIEDKSENKAIADFIMACSWIKENCVGVGIFCDVSALTSPFADRPTLRAALHSAFLYHAVPNGLSMGLIDTEALMPYCAIEPSLRQCCEDVILEGTADTCRSLDRCIKNLADDKIIDIETLTQKEGALFASIILADAQSLAPLVEQASLSKEAAKEFVENELSKSVERLYLKFSNREIFLPELMSSAELIGSCIKPLEARLSLEKGSNQKVLVPSIQGDVKDMGRQILSLQLLAKNYQIEKLSGRPTPESIINQAIELSVDAIILSGVLRSARKEIIRIMQAAKRKELSIPILVAGPGVSAEWMAAEGVPIYGEGAILFNNN